MPVALSWVAFHAHHGDRVTHIQKPVQISLEVWRYDAVVIPIPNCFAGTRIDCSGAHVSRHSPFAQVDIFDPCALKPTLKVGFAQLRSIHTHRIVANVEDTSNASRLQSVEYLVGLPPFISEREKVGPLDRSGLIPERLTLFAEAP